MNLSRRKAVIERLWDISKDCFYCTIALTFRSRSLEHILPLSKGGTNQQDNLCLTCHDCNAMKGDMTLAEFVDYIADVGGFVRAKELHHKKRKKVDRG